jgi:peroxiredoxin
MAAGRQPKILDAGSPVPDVRLKLLKGGETSLREIAAKGPALLAFFKISCPVCQMTFPFLERIHAAGTLPVIGISQNDERDTRDFNEDFGITFPTLLDDEDGGFPASNAFGISSVPAMFLVEPNGEISHVIEGWRKQEMEFLARKAGTALFRQGDNVPEWKAG